MIITNKIIFQKSSEVLNFDLEITFIINFFRYLTLNNLILLNYLNIVSYF